MESEHSPSIARVVEEPVNGSVPNKKMRVKVPKKIHKSEREKLKRDRLNELFVELSHALDPARQNIGKATTLSDAAKLLRELFTQLESLKKDKVDLLKEFHYVTVEKNELEDDNAALQGDIGRLQNQIQATMQPLNQELQQAMVDVALPLLSSSPKPSSHISRPHARYPTPDSWSLEFLSANLEVSGVAPQNRLNGVEEA